MVEALLKGKFGEEAGLLIRFAVVGSTKRRLAVVLEQFGKLLAAYAQRLVANVTVAAPLSESQKSALESALSKSHGHALRLNIEVDPAILGGVKVQIAGEIIDGSVANRLKQARMMLV
jgi:F-type H+-transporting ATPase subunit delta